MPARRTRLALALVLLGGLLGLFGILSFPFSRPADAGGKVAGKQKGEPSPGGKDERKADRAGIVQAIRSYIAKQRMSRDEFAQRAKLGKSTVDKLVVGIFSEKTILQIEAQLEISLLDPGTSREGAAEELGGYSRQETRPYVGNYIFARPSFQDDGLIELEKNKILIHERNRLREKVV